ncbi:MAG: hypothetical protein JWP68_418 [Modestobacter sp.]|jgi:hypothetical protein|nr:hypothetical protein [Modestobacter sp.]
MAPDSTDRSADIRSALSEYQLNEATTSGAPQQQVVNGWVARDLLTVIAEEGNSSRDGRVPALVGLLVLGIALFAFTTPQVQSHEADSGPATPTTPTHEPMPESI